jgi:hypothetical protein
MVMRFTSGGIGHKSTQTNAMPIPDAEVDGIDVDSFADEGLMDSDEGAHGGEETNAPDAGSDGCDDIEGVDDVEVEEVEFDEENDYGYADEEEDDEGDDETEDATGLGPEDGEEGWEDDILDLEGYAAL